MALHKKLAYRSNIYKKEQALAKGVVFYLNGLYILKVLTYATNLQYDQFPPQDMTREEIINLIKTAPSGDVFLEA